MNERKLRFWRWFRTLPLLVVALVGILSFLVQVAPGALMRKVFFPVSYEDAIIESSSRHGVDPLLVCSIIKCESDWDAGAESGVGAVGLMQVMPSTAETLAGMGYVDPYAYDPYSLSDPATCIEYGCACLDYLDDHLETTDQVVAAYNAGLGTVQEWLQDGIPDISSAITYPETRFYLLKVNESYNAYQRLYGRELNPL
jgi:soluble lytic murein transglycosylase